jgi:hypothetical protein
MRRAAASRRAFAFGASLPFAMAPFLSLTGDAYEIGSILVRNPVLRGDDVLKMAEVLGRTPGAPWAGFALAALLGVVWAFLTWWAGYALSRSQSLSGASRAMARPPSEPT